MNLDRMQKLDLAGAANMPPPATELPPLPPPARRTKSLDLVLRDCDGDAWVYVGGGKYAGATDVQDGHDYAGEFTREEIEDATGGATVTERWEIWA